MAEHFFGRRRGRGREQGEPEKLESPEDIRLAEERESLFDKRSRRNAAKTTLTSAWSNEKSG